MFNVYKGTHVNVELQKTFVPSISQKNSCIIFCKCSRNGLSTVVVKWDSRVRYTCGRDKTVRRDQTNDFIATPSNDITPWTPFLKAQLLFRKYRNSNNICATASLNRKEDKS